MHPKAKEMLERMREAPLSFPRPPDGTHIDEPSWDELIQRHTAKGHSMERPPGLPTKDARTPESMRRSECLTRTVDEHLAERAVSEERKLLIEIADVIAVSSSLGESAWWMRMEKRLAAIGIEV